jgi:hypothetical protein
METSRRYCVWGHHVDTKCLWRRHVETNCVLRNHVGTNCVRKQSVDTQCVWSHYVDTNCVWRHHVDTNKLCRLCILKLISFYTTHRIFRTVQVLVLLLQTVVQFAKQQYACHTTCTSQKAELTQTAAYAKVQKPCIRSHSVLSCWQLASSLTLSVGEIFIATSTPPPTPTPPHPQSCR